MFWFIACISVSLVSGFCHWYWWHVVQDGLGEYIDSLERLSDVLQTQREQLSVLLDEIKDLRDNDGEDWKRA